MIPLRSPDQVMRLARLGSMHQTRLSFMRVLLRGLRRGGWVTDRPVWQIDDTGHGHAVYRVRGEGQCLSLVAFSHDLPADKRSDRVIAEAWDTTFALVDGDVDAADIRRLAANVPLQEAGRISDRELVMSRANKSVRLWDHVVEQLAAGAQPDPDKIEDVGYLMRTTAVYGSGKFGAADHAALAGRPLLDGPFRAEMLTVWLIRSFVLDLVEHVAKARGGPAAATLSPELRRRFGIGNSTGLGMAPFLVHHPRLLNAWMAARETALARIRALSKADSATRASFRTALARSHALLDCWTTDHTYQAEKLAQLRIDLRQLTDHVEAGALTVDAPWNALWLWAEDTLSLEGQELTVSLMIEPHGDLVDDLAQSMGADELSAFRIDGSKTVGETRRTIEQSFAWANEPDYSTPEHHARFWYVSEAKLEPRLGERFEEPGGELEQPLDVARSVADLAAALALEPQDQAIAAFLRAHPQHRRAVRRVQNMAEAPFAEIRDNLISEDVMPIDMLRCKLSFFGATRFDPRSDRWVRITMYQGAPFPHELHELPEDDWVLPEHAEPAA